MSLEQRIPPVENLLAFIEEQETRLLGRAYDIKGTDAREFQVIYGVCAQAIRYAAAFAALHRAGRPREAVVLARQAIEHAATAQWAHFTEGGLKKLVTTIQATHLDFYSQMSTWLQNEQLVDAMEAETERLGQLGKGVNTTYIAAMAAMFAAWLVEDLIVGKPGMPRLDQQSDELLLPINVEKQVLSENTAEFL